MEDMKEMTGKFGYKERGIPTPHYIPNEVHDDLPVIVFPADDSHVIVGNTYSFFAKMTWKATYSVDGRKYRVAHAIGILEVTGADNYAHSY